VPPPPAVSPAPGAAAPADQENLSVIIPHGGEERLRNLRAALQNLTRQKISDLVVVEMDEVPRARDLVTAAGFTHVFAEQRGPFHKARVMNMGIPFARRDLILWLDSDLLFEPGFLPRAVAEIETRRLDFLVPWTSVRYLGEADSEAVAAGRKSASECVPVNAYFSRTGARGGAVLVRAELLKLWGGQIEEFVGWGGEDNAFFLKAALLGRAGVTHHSDQHIHHLYHPRSGGHGPEIAMAGNPNYKRNLALLHETRALCSRERFLRRFPPPGTFPAPWHGTRRIACAPGAEEIGRALAELYGSAVELCGAAEPHDHRIDCEGGEGKTEPRLQALAFAARAALSGPPAGALPEALERPMTVARKADLDLPEVAAFNHGRSYPVMRRWEMPFALFQSRLSPGLSVLDCTINPVDFRDRLLSLYPSVRHEWWKPVEGGAFVLSAGLADQTFDRAICVNTLEHLLRPQRELLIADLARKLKPGGLLVLTCDYYFDDFWSRPEILAMGVMRPDREEIFNGWNQVTPGELADLCARNGLQLVSGPMAEPEESDASLYRNIEPYPHACIAGVFRKEPGPAPSTGKKIVLSLLTWNTRDISLESLQAYRREAEMLRRLGHDPFIVVCDNGSIDGTREALHALSGQMEIPHQFLFNDGNRGNSVARNQVIDRMIDLQADYLLFMDGDIEIIPASSHAMLRHMEESGPRLGCLGLDSFRHAPWRHRVTPYLYSLAGLRLESTNLVAWTQYGLFRREVFESGVRFDETDPFDREGWGFEDNDLAFQMHLQGFSNQKVCGLTYLHRHPHSSIRVMRSFGVDPNVSCARRKEYVLRKWAGHPEISGGPLNHVRSVNVRL
jgi:glycosyltransferase involved in cell wall biosynthesis